MRYPRSRRRFFLPAVLASCTFTPFLHADNTAPANAAPQPAKPQLAGRVLDPSGAIIPGAAVELSDTSGATHDTVADAGGLYSFNNLPAGSYTLLITAPGFAPQTITDIQLSENKPLSLDLNLKIETAQQDVQVTQDSDLSDTAPSKNGDAIIMKGDDLGMLSTNTEQMQQQLQAMAGAAGGDSSSLYVNGFSNGQMPPKDTIREIRINQNPFSAEYEEPGNGRIEIFTKPGSDKFHGALIGFGTDSAFDSKNPFTPAPQPYHSSEVNAYLDGPLGKKTSFFAGIRLNRLANISVVSAIGLDADNNVASITGATSSPNDYNGFTGSIDRAVTKNNTFTAHLDYGHRNKQNQGVGQLQVASQGYNSINNFTVLQLSDTQVFSPKIINETRFQYQRNRSAQVPVTEAPALIVQGAFTGGGSNLGRITDNGENYEFQNYATFDLGKHYIRAGIRFRGNRDANASSANYNGEYIFPTIAAYQITQRELAAGVAPAQIRLDGGGASQFSLTTGNPSASVFLFDTAFFAEDTWKVSKKLTATYGLRFESQTRIPDPHDFAPRVAMTYNIGGNDKKGPFLVAQGGFGVFYTRFPSTDLLQVERLNGISQQQFVLTNPDTFPTIPSIAELSQGEQNQSATYQISGTYHSPYQLFYSGSLQHSFAQHGSLTLGYRGLRGDHLLLSRNINAPLPGTYNPNGPQDITNGVRPFNSLQNKYEYDTAGSSNRNSLYLNGRITTKLVSVFANYNLSYNRSDTNGNFPTDQYDVHQDYGRDTNDHRHTVFLGEFFNLPLGIDGGTFFIAQSGGPFDITVGQDLNGDSQYNDRPAFATDLSRASVVRTRYGNFDTAPIAGQTIIPRNYAQGPGLIVLNSFWEKNFHFGPEIKPPADAPKPTLKPGQKPPKPERKFTLSGGLEVDNILNHVNAASPVGTLGSPLFGQFNALNNWNQTSANRELDFFTSFRF